MVDFFPPTIHFSYAKLSARSCQNLFKFILIVICSVMAPCFNTEKHLVFPFSGTARVNQ